MNRKQPPETLWLLAALAAPAAHFAGCGWLIAGLTAATLLPLSLLCKRWEGFPKPVAMLQILWLGIVAGSLLPAGAVYWPSDNDLAVPLTLLVLAACTGAAAAPRIGAVLAFCMGLLAIPLAVSAAGSLKPEWLRPNVEGWSAGLAAVLLIPSLPAAREDRKGKVLLTAGVLTILSAALVQSVISPEAAVGLEDAFYQTTRTLGYLEPVAAVGMTLGWYALTILLLQSAKEIAKNSGIGQITAIFIPVGAAAGCVLFGVRLGGWILPLLSGCFWILIPFWRRKSFLKKCEKRC